MGRCNSIGENQHGFCNTSVGRRVFPHEQKKKELISVWWADCYSQGGRNGVSSISVFRRLWSLWDFHNVAECFSK